MWVLAWGLGVREAAAGDAFWVLGPPKGSRGSLLLHKRPHPTRPCLGATRAHFVAGPTVAPKERSGSKSARVVAKTRQVRRPRSLRVETLPGNELRPGLSLQLEDALGLAGPAATRELSASTRLHLPFLPPDPPALGLSSWALSLMAVGTGRPERSPGRRVASRLK